MAGVPSNFYNYALYKEWAKYHETFADKVLRGLNPIWHPPTPQPPTTVPLPSQVKAYAHNQPKQRRPDEPRPTDEERRAEEMKRFLDGKRTAPDLHAEGCECWKCKPAQW